MSAIVIITPVIIANWPVITAAAAGAASALGFTLRDVAKQELAEAQQVGERRVEVELADSEVLSANVATGQELVVTKGAVTLRVRRDERGRCAICATGIGHSDAELTAMAEEFSQKMTQCFVYNKVMTELRSRGFQVITEEQTEDQSVRIHVRNWGA